MSRDPDPDFDPVPLALAIIACCAIGLAVMGLLVWVIR